MGGCYKIPNVQTDIVGVFTNKCPTDAIRGAGRPEATQMIEVTLDQLAHELGMDPLEIRRKNFIPKEDFPAAVATGVVYDSGDYHKTLDRLMEHVDVAAFRARAGAAALRGRLPRDRLLHLDRDLRPGALAGHRSGRRRRPGRPVGVGDGPRPQHRRGHRLHRHLAHGQGHETAMAQIVADKLGVDPSIVEVIHGDTATGPEGRNTYGSRSLATGGEAVAKATDKVADKAKAIVAAELEAARRGHRGRRRQVLGQGLPGQGHGAGRRGRRGLHRRGPEGMEPGLEETTFYDPENFVFPFGAHACVVDVDADTGKVKVIRYVAVDDCGKAMNPMLIDGQIHGGVVHGIGQALYERVHYDDDGQLVTGTFVDYALPTAAELPSFETDRTETPSPVNSMGVKGVGEAGTIAASAAVTNAVIDALRPLGVDYINMPLSPMRVWTAITEAKGGAA